VITGDVMEIRKGGDITVSRGNSKAVNGKNVIEAREMVYNKKKSLLSAKGAVKLFSKSDENEPLEAYGGFASYDTSRQKGKLWGDEAEIKYYMNSSSAPLVLKAAEIYVDRSIETLSAYKDVRVVTSSGTIYSDNAVFYKKDGSVVMEKEQKRPLADVVYDGRKGVYEADKMVFYNSDENKKILMSGKVSGKIEMEDKIQ
jgi:lipopolysaccharide export system protein LptA